MHYHTLSIALKSGKVKETALTLQLNLLKQLNLKKQRPLLTCTDGTTFHFAGSSKDIYYFFLVTTRHNQ